jgi:hypothetical protein
MALIDPITGKPIWYEGDHGEQRDPFRDWIRTNCPTGSEGFVCENLDIVINCYGKLIGRGKNDDGRIKLIEKKINSEMKYAQKRTFELIDSLIKKADPMRKNYRGLYTVSLPLIKNEDDYNNAEFIVTTHPENKKQTMNARKFLAFLKDQDE